MRGDVLRVLFRMCRPDVVLAFRVLFVLGTLSCILLILYRAVIPFLMKDPPSIVLSYPASPVTDFNGLDLDFVLQKSSLT